MFLAAYLRSKLARYFLFHTAANWETERDKVHFDELLRLPFPLPGNECIESQASEIIRTVATKLRRFKRKIERASRLPALDKHDFSLSSETERDARKRIMSERRQEADRLQCKLDLLIYRYFDLIDQEIALVEDTALVYEPSATPHKRTDSIPSMESIDRNNVNTYSTGLQPYADTLTQTLNEWASGGAIRVAARGGVDETNGLALVTLTQGREEEPFTNEDFSGKLAVIFASVIRASAEDSGGLNYLRGLIVFEGNRVHLAKPYTLANWTKTAALNDAADIHARVAEARRDRNGRRR